MAGDEKIMDIVRALLDDSLKEEAASSSLCASSPLSHMDRSLMEF
jgi:hypothetical protein